MANTHSAKKAVRKINRRADVNRSRRSQMRTYVRKVEEAIAAGDPGAAAAAALTRAKRGCESAAGCARNSGKKFSHPGSGASNSMRLRTRTSTSRYRQNF